MFVYRDNRDKGGFSLIELTIVLVIIGLIVAGIADLFHAYLMKKQIEQQEQVFAGAQDAFSRFFNSDPDPLDADDTEVEGRFPCPADPALGPGDADFGIERRDAGGCLAEGAIVEVTGSTGQVFIGALPFATLGISMEAAMDNKNNKLTYAVSEALTANNVLNAANPPPGAITIEQELGGSVTTINDAEFALISHGQTGTGAYTLQGVPHAAGCDTDAVEGENCDRDDAIFRDFEIAQAGGSTFFDDNLTFSLIGSNGTNDQFWRFVDGSTEDITNRNTGNVGIGTAPNPPSALLDVAGAIRASRGSGAQYLEMVDDSSAGALITSHSPESNKKRLRLRAVNDGSGGAAGENTINFEVGDASGPTTAMIVRENGNVGIGTTNPGSRLHVNTGESSNLGVFQASELGISSPFRYLELQGTFPEVRATGIRARNSTGSQGFVRYEFGNDAQGIAQWDIFAGGGGAADLKMSILENGNVGIGESTPTEKLDVAGDVKAESAKMTQFCDASGSNCFPASFIANLIAFRGCSSGEAISNIRDDGVPVCSSIDGGGSTEPVTCPCGTCGDTRRRCLRSQPTHCVRGRCTGSECLDSVNQVCTSAGWR